MNPTYPEALPFRMLCTIFITVCPAPRARFHPTRYLDLAIVFKPEIRGISYESSPSSSSQPLES